MSEVGFDDGALFDTLSQPKRTKVVRVFDDAGNCIEEVTTTQSWWDVIMITGGPVMIMAVVGLVKTITSKVPEWFDETETSWIKEHPLAFLALGPIGFKLMYQKAEIAGTVSDINKQYGAGFLVRQLAENWGFTPGEPKDTAHEGWHPDPSTVTDNWTATITLSTGERLMRYGSSTSWVYADGRQVTTLQEAVRLFQQARDEGRY